MPYAHFIQAFSQPIEDYELEEEQRASVVREHLDVIASDLTRQGQTVRSAFVARDGFISAEAFAAGLRNIGYRDTSQDTLAMLVDALQYEGDDGPEAVAIHVEELEELFEYYGVVRDLRETSFAEVAERASF